MSFHNLMTIYKYTILPAITYSSETWSISISKRAKVKLQQTQRSFRIFITKAYRTVSHETLSAIAEIMPIDQAMHLYKDMRAISKGQTTNAVIIELKKLEIPNKTRGIHPRDNYICADLSETERNAIVSRGIPTHNVVFKSGSWYSNSSRGGQIRLSGIQISLPFKVNSLRQYCG